MTETRINQVDETGLTTTDGQMIPADLVIWSTGV